MLVITVKNKSQAIRLEHRAGPLEFGCREKPGHDRVVIQDKFVSPDHLTLVELRDGRLCAECLSEAKPVFLNQGEALPFGELRVLALPARLQIGDTSITVVAESEPASPRSESSNLVVPSSRATCEAQSLSELGESPAPTTLVRWFETLLQVQRAAIASNAFFAETARAVVDLVGLDHGLVLLRQGSGWNVKAKVNPTGRSCGFSHQVIQDVCERKETVLLTNPEEVPMTQSLIGVDAVVAAPIFDSLGEVVGVVYGCRDRLTNRGLPHITPLEAQVVQLLAAIVGAGLIRVQKEVEAAADRSRLEQFASPELAHELYHNPHLLDGAEREITVLFCDLRGFSRIAECLGAATTYWLLGDVMDRLTDCVFKHQGVVVDYYGDGLCAMWNAPLDQSDHADRACRAAQDMHGALPGLDLKWRPIIGDYFHLGIGIHTGVALIGNAGSQRRMKYGPRGHCVNLASRVEGVTKHLDVPIVLTGGTQQALTSPYSLRRLCRARLTGVEEAVDLYQLNTSGESPAWSWMRDTYEAALRHYEERRWPEALMLLIKIGTDQRLPRDAATAALRRRVQSRMRESPADFDGVWQFESK